MEQNKQLMDLTKVLKSKIKRAKEQLKDLEILIDEGSASSRQKQEYIVLKAKVEEREDLLALVEGMTE